MSERLRERIGQLSVGSWRRGATRAGDLRRLWLAGLALLLTGCGVRPSGVTDSRDAPTGVASGMTLYFVDGHRRLVPDQRPTDHLGTIAEAMALLLTGPGPDSALHTEIESRGNTRVEVTALPGLIGLRVPLALAEVTPLGIDQLVCTALGAWVQSGGSKATRVQVSFTTGAAESEQHRACPLIK